MKMLLSFLTTKGAYACCTYLKETAQLWLDNVCAFPQEKTISVLSVLHSSSESDLWVRFTWSGDCFNTPTTFVCCNASEQCVAMRSWPLWVRLNTGLERGVELLFASTCSVNEEKVCVVRVSFSAPDHAVAGLNAWDVSKYLTFLSGGHVPLVSALSEHRRVTKGEVSCHTLVSFHIARSEVAATCWFPPLASFSAPVRVADGSAQVATKKEK